MKYFFKILLLGEEMEIFFSYVLSEYDVASSLISSSRVNLFPGQFCLEI